MTHVIEDVRIASRRRLKVLTRWYRRQDVGRLAAFAVAGIVVLAILLFVFQAWRASSDLRQAAGQAELLQEQVIGGDAAARLTLEDLQSSTASAAGHTDGPLWAIGSKLPLLGKNISVLRDVSSVLDGVAREALPPVVEVSDQVNVNAFSPRDGTVDLTTVATIAPAVAAADAALTAARDELDRIDAGGLLLPLRGPVTTIKDKIDSAQQAAASSDVAARLMPTMLGRDGTRRYLLLIQNNAEVRATGGIPGSYAVITAKNGRLSMGEQGSIFDLPRFPEPVLPMTDSEKTVFTEQLVTDLRDVTVTPHFPRSGEIALAMAAKGLDVDVDGVISVDPVAMSYILGGTGPVTVETGLEGLTEVALDQNNAVELLLNTVYLAFTDLDAQDDFFEKSARAIFDAVKSGAAPSRPVISAMVRAADENRLMLWSSHADEQSAIEETGLSGVFADDSGDSPHVGVYFGDAVGGKMQYYFDHTAGATATRCVEGGRQLITLRAELISNAPRGLPKRVAGIDPDVPAGQMRLITWLYAPFGGRFVDIRLDDEPQLITTAKLGGRAETSVPVTLEPGQRRTLTATMVTAPGQDADGSLATTPGLQTLRNDTPIPSACG